MDPSEVEFLAEKELVKIIPNFSLDKIYLIGVSTVYEPVWVETELHALCRSTFTTTHF